VRHNLLIALAGSALLLSACSAQSSDQEAATGSEQLLIATTVSPITSIASRVGG